MSEKLTIIGYAALVGVGGSVGYYVYTQRVLASSSIGFEFDVRTKIDSIPISLCSKKHQKIYLEWFSFVDSDGDGRITGSDARKFLTMANLSQQDLKMVWMIADSKQQGYLGLKEFITAMQLCS